MTQAHTRKGKINSGHSGTAGVYEVLARLSLHGWTAVPTPGNTKGFDIVACKKVGTKMLTRLIEVKSRHRKQPVNSQFWGKSLIWTMDQKHEHAMKDVWYAFVNFEGEFDGQTGQKLSSGTARTTIYLATSKQVAKFAQESHPMWVQSQVGHKDTSMRYFCLGFQTCKYPFKSILYAENCYEKWDLLEKEAK